jgi:integrase/recombinase XerD
VIEAIRLVHRLEPTMETITRPGTPLRHRMLDDMRMRKFAEHTQDGYIRAVRKLAAFLGRSPDSATIEDLRRFQLHLVDAGTGPVTINATITGLKFFFDITLGRPEVMAKMQRSDAPQAARVRQCGLDQASLAAGSRRLRGPIAIAAALTTTTVAFAAVSSLEAYATPARTQRWHATASA